MSIEKTLRQAPQGIAALAEEELPEITVSIAGDEDEVDEPDPTPEENPEFTANLAEKMQETELTFLANDLLGDFNNDTQARKEWLETYVKGLKLLGLKFEDKTEPWLGASGVFHPMLMEAAVKFQSETIMETFPAAGPVRTVIIGKETRDKKDAAARVQEDMNYELTQRMTEYRPEHERLLLGTALSGNGFKKIYFDPALGRQTAPYIPVEDIVVPYGAANIESAERITHVMRKTKNELRKLQVAGFYRDIDMGEPVQIMDEIEKVRNPDKGATVIQDRRFQLLEMHVNVDLIGDEHRDEKGSLTGIERPYVVTLEKGTTKVLAIRRNWLEGDKNAQRRQHFTHYGYIPGFGFYNFGLIHLIGGHTQTATSLLRQLLDAGTLSNLPGGLKARGLRIKNDDTPVAPGEFRDVDLPSGAIRDNILPLPYKEPSQVLMALMDKVVLDGQQFAGVGDLSISDMSAQAPVGSTLAILERVLKVMSAVQARIHYTMKQEFKLIAAIIRDNTDEDYDYEPETGDAGAKKSDYDMCDVLPVSDPNAATMAQRVIQYQAVMQLSATAPQIYDMPFLHRQMIEVLGVKNTAKIIPMQADMSPIDPVSENMAVMIGKPVKAFMYQDHQSHLAVHMAAMQDPKLMALIGQNPQAQSIMSAAAAHVMEHLAYEYRAQIQTKLGTTLPPPPKAVLVGDTSEDDDDDPGYLDPQTEVQISQLAAMAAQQLLVGNQMEMKAQQVQQQQQDPVIQMQQQELQIKQQELTLKQKIADQDGQIKQAKSQSDQAIAQSKVQIAQMDLLMKKLEAIMAQQEAQAQAQEQHRKSQKDLTDAASKADELHLRKTDMENKHEIAGAKLGADIGHNKEKLELEGAKLGSSIGQQKATLQHQHTQTGIDGLKHAATLHQQNEHKTVDLAHQKAESTANRAAAKAAVKAKPAGDKA